MGHTLDMLIEVIKTQIDLPKADVEQNLRSVLNECISKMDLVSQQEIERQKVALEQANLKLVQLQQQLAVLESKLKP